eukprot:TRINITY_DN18068_c0_g1_i1.p1 TRINITY_DN18068_c0_g1~~TRINITY_DN18068_c0_g1_i1.p1  ORF type:complete len:657 (+),score=112.01 TRINITY_DN18068_c0_g1_i1:492-2462(+)
MISLSAPLVASSVGPLLNKGRVADRALPPPSSDTSELVPPIGQHLRSHGVALPFSAQGHRRLLQSSEAPSSPAWLPWSLRFHPPSRRLLLLLPWGWTAPHASVTSVSVWDTVRAWFGPLGSSPSSSPAMGNMIWRGLGKELPPPPVSMDGAGYQDLISSANTGTILPSLGLRTVINAHSQLLTWEGWGTSLCWWANFAGGLHQADQDLLLDLFFDPQLGLGFNIARYNIGGSPPIAPSTDHSIARAAAFKAVPSFQPSKGEYDWSADANQRKVLLGAVRRGVTILEAFSNSPPHWMTVSGSCTGASKKFAENLRPECAQDFADYLTEVVRHYRDEWKVTFDFLEPFNEPVEGWWVQGGPQEGCNFSREGMERVIPLVAASLQEKGLHSTKMSGIDAWAANTWHAVGGLKPEVLAHISQINVHGYYRFSPDDSFLHRALMWFWRKQVKVLADRLGKPVWQSEAGPLNFPGTSEIRGAVNMALVAIMDINVMHARAWLYWQALEVTSTNFWGLIQAPFIVGARPTWERKKQFFTLMHFTKWIRPGSTILRVGPAVENELLAALNPAASTLVLVLANISATRRLLRTLALKGLVRASENETPSLSVYRTSAVEEHALLFDGLPLDLTDGLQLPVVGEVESVTTFVVKGVKEAGAGVKEV